MKLTQSWVYSGLFTATRWASVSFSREAEISHSGSPSPPSPSLPSSMLTASGSSTHRRRGARLPLPFPPAASQRFHGDVLLMNEPRDRASRRERDRAEPEQRRKELEPRGGGCKERGRQVGCGGEWVTALCACRAPHLRANRAKRGRLRGGAGVDSSPHPLLRWASRAGTSGLCSPRGTTLPPPPRPQRSHPSNPSPFLSTLFCILSAQSGLPRPLSKPVRPRAAALFLHPGRGPCDSTDLNLSGDLDLTNRQPGEIFPRWHS